MRNKCSHAGSTRNHQKSRSFPYSLSSSHSKQAFGLKIFLVRRDLKWCRSSSSSLGGGLDGPLDPAALGLVLFLGARVFFVILQKMQEDKGKVRFQHWTEKKNMSKWAIEFSRIIEHSRLETEFNSTRVSENNILAIEYSLPKENHFNTLHSPKLRILTQ